eukprot:gb/GECG01004378.1/.p1 GENE.gb/GECG01004378.1/~~gb/GECG01004378.1/.p1  ORF type:complete len:101 (+),score=7.13 gb/GECG01004378.1/:1-303(+)
MKDQGRITASNCHEHTLRNHGSWYIPTKDLNFVYAPPAIGDEFDLFQKPEDSCEYDHVNLYVAEVTFQCKAQNEFSMVLIFLDHFPAILLQKSLTYGHTR